MTRSAFPPQWHAVVRAHHAHTAGYVVAETGSCLELQAQETRTPRGRVPGRRFTPLPPATLRSFRPPKSWFLGIVLCPGDDLLVYRDWYARLPERDQPRVVLFAHPDFLRDEIDRVWGELGAPVPVVAPIRGDWAQFHQVYGRLHGDRVFRDHAHPPAPPDKPATKT